MQSPWYNFKLQILFVMLYCTVMAQFICTWRNHVTLHNLANIGSGNGLGPASNNPLLEPMMTCYQYLHVPFNQGEVVSTKYQYLQCVWNFTELQICIPWANELTNHSFDPNWGNWWMSINAMIAYQTGYTQRHDNAALLWMINKEMEYKFYAFYC